MVWRLSSKERFALLILVAAVLVKLLHMLWS